MRVRMNQKVSGNKEVFAPYLQAFQRGTELRSASNSTVALITFYHQLNHSIIKYLSLTLMFCFLAFFSCEREDTFSEAHGPVEATTQSEAASEELKSASILSGVSADIQTLSAYLGDNFKDLSTITEADLETAAAATGVDLRAVYAQVQDGISLMNERNEDPIEVGSQVALNTSIRYSVGNEKLPCLEAYVREMGAVALRVSECMGSTRSNPYLVGACTAGYVILASVADNNFDKCLNRTYPNP